MTHDHKRLVEAKPCRHIERAIKSVRPVLRSALPYALRRANGITSSAWCRAATGSSLPSQWRVQWQYRRHL